MTADHENRLCKAIAFLKSSTSALSNHDSRIAGFAARAKDLLESAERSRVATRKARAAELVAGSALPASNGDDPGAADAREADAAETAAELLRDERPALVARLRRAEADVTDATLAFARAFRDVAASDALSPLAALREPLARMIASDRVRIALAGETFTFDAGKHPPAELWSGAHQARALLSAMPERFGGKAFAAQVEAEAERIASHILETMEPSDA
jgi:hypothetical protein